MKNNGKNDWCQVVSLYCIKHYLYLRKFSRGQIDDFQENNIWQIMQIVS